MRRAAHAGLLYGTLAAGALLTLAPLLWMASASLMPTGEATALPLHLWPSRVTFEHYTELFTRLNLARIIHCGPTLQLHNDPAIAGESPRNLLR